ncbi:virion membrane component, involved in entry [Squirrelpox virus]|uniref:Virion membrane component, involved in entry n=1 Tax=Squirrelpox virus TaxID=240426 RepID=U3UBI1_9POXV|nr:virion membrane component, involved in entry [Squirrelpox virus]CCD83220.1 virion membrane component, involved in entry [Squirrelpox virus]
MDKLCAAVFGVFISSSEEDLDGFVDVVTAVLADKPVRKGPAGDSWLPYLLIGLAVLIGVIAVMVYAVPWKSRIQN